MAEQERRASRFVVRGRVQGVGFRWWATKTAERVGVVGWIRNRPDGTVEAVAEGSDGSVRTFRERLEEGPPSARVVEVEEEPAEPGESRTFEIRH